MRILFVIAVIFTLLTGCAGVQSMQPIAEADRTFEKIIEVPGYSKEQIFNGTKIWIAENFTSAKAVIEYENKEDGTIIGNGVLPYPCDGMECLATANWKAPFTMRVDTKDQKFRLTFSNLHVSWPASYNSTFGAQSAHDGPINNQGALDAIKPELLKLGDQLLASLKSGKANNNW